MGTIQEVAGLLKKFNSETKNVEQYDIVSLLISLLNNGMRIETLGQVIISIEQIQFESSSRQFTIAQILKEKGKPCLTADETTHSLIIQNKPFKQASLSAFFKSGLCFDVVLLETHQKLLSLHKEQLKTQWTLDYKDQLSTSTEFKYMTLTTKEEAHSNSHIIPDLTRGGIALEGFSLQGVSDVEAKDALEKFCNDSVDNASSKANKLFHFGGQFLQASISKEIISKLMIQFNDGTYFLDEISMGYSTGKIVWKKSSDGDIFAVIDLAFLSIAHHGNIYVVDPDSNNCHLKAISDSEDGFEETLNILKNERAGDTQGAVMPVISAKAIINLVQEQDGLALKVTQLNVRYNVCEATHVNNVIQLENSNNNNSLCA